MKNIIICFFVVFALASCIGGASYESTYPLAADFEYQMSDKDKFFGEDGAFYDNSLIIGDVMFNCKKLGSEFTGFAWSVAKDEDNSKCEERFKVYDKKAAGGSDGFAVFSLSPVVSLDHHIVFGHAKNGTFVPLGCMVHNTKAVAKYILEGPNKFERGDSLKLTATGILNGQATGKVDIMLADYRQRDSLVSKWTEFKLDKLGNVEYIDFSLTSSKPVPQYFCMDNFYGKVSVSIK